MFDSFDCCQKDFQFNWYMQEWALLMPSAAKKYLSILAHGPFYITNLVHLVFAYGSIIEIMPSHRI